MPSIELDGGAAARDGEPRDVVEVDPCSDRIALRRLDEQRPQAGQQRELRHAWRRGCADRTEAYVVAARASVPPAVASAEIVTQSAMRYTILKPG